jgi:Mce-associated membrane protein
MTAEESADTSGSENGASAAATPRDATLAPRKSRRNRAEIIGLALVAAIAMAGSLAGWLYVTQLRSDQRTDAAASQAAVTAASDGTVAVLSYSAQNLNRDLAGAKSHLTGDFLSYYQQFTDNVVVPAAKLNGVQASAAVVRAALSQIHPNSAIVLVFVNQSSTSKDHPDPVLRASSIRVRLQRIDDRWLIDAFDPV